MMVAVNVSPKPGEHHQRFKIKCLKPCHILTINLC